MLRWHFRGFPSAGVHGAPERNIVRLHRREGEWALMGHVKGVHPGAGKEVTEERSCNQDLRRKRKRGSWHTSDALEICKERKTVAMLLERIVKLNFFPYS